MSTDVRLPRAPDGHWLGFGRSTHGRAGSPESRKSCFRDGVTVPKKKSRCEQCWTENALGPDLSSWSFISRMFCSRINSAESSTKGGGTITVIPGAAGVIGFRLSGHSSPDRGTGLDNATHERALCPKVKLKSFGGESVLSGGTTPTDSV